MGSNRKVLRVAESGMGAEMSLEDDYRASVDELP